ncbi:PREDICTED: uncharacterized protein LOC109244105 [Nicotiana attenuata]|uniref:uncharacterized protein LOC109244105 n=1 Tax=Nicotiana attenuata TaxID=49451 RepID=UPI00090495E0|nr:PREDICTED: uncharacterized protein LOC109244105 [Nicotiana attenuata]
MEVGQTSNQKEKPNVFNSQNVEATYDMDRGEIQSNYLKLISGTNLEEEQNSDYVYDLKHGQQSDSSSEEESSSKDMDYADEESSEASEEYASVDSEEIYSDDQADTLMDPPRDNSDDHADILVDTFCTQSLVDIAVTSELDTIDNKAHLSTRGRGRGRGNTRGGRQTTRGRGGRHSTYQPECRVIEESEQQVTCEIKWNGDTIIISAVYAKCDAVLREDLWDSLRDIADRYKLPWLIAGDFNCIVDPGEKKGGKPHGMSKSLPFIQCIMDCELIDPGYSGSIFTWCNGWCPEKRIWKRLDRVLINQEWLNLFDSTSVNHLIRTGSDHSPLFVIAKTTHREPIKYFRFLDFWTKEADFSRVVEQAWNMEVQGSPMWKFHMKLKNTCKKLSEWSRNTLGNIFDKIEELEHKVEEMETNIIADNSEVNRAGLNQANALLVRAYKKEESFWKQKSGVKWFVEGEVNSKFFHSVVKGRKKRLTLKKMRKEDGTWVEGDEEIAHEAISFFQNQFTRENFDNDFSVLGCIPTIIDDADNEKLIAVPTMEELKDVVFSMSSQSAPGPDGVSGKFYHSCWEIIKEDLLLMVLDFFAELRPISLSNFSCKILSKLVNQRLSPLMQKLVSPNQTGFIKGRSITENIMLTQDMVHNIVKPSASGNVVLKLDMAKAYDRVSWEYLCQVLRQMGFSEIWIDIVWRLMTNVWYSININGVRHGFFKSSRGIKQGDPLSPSLFVIGAELLSRLMDNLIDSGFIPYSVDKKGPNISHLCYADDTILFSSADPTSLILMMSKLEVYEKVSGQMVNKGKSGFYTSLKEGDTRITDISRITGFSYCQFPMIYLGCPIYVGRKKVVYFNNMVAKVANRMQGWQGRLLSYGGKAVLIKSVLHALPLHLLAVVHPPKTVLNQIDKIIANFYWGKEDSRNKRHWIAWSYLCFPVQEGGVGFRSLQDTCNAFSAKLWWNFRTQNTLLKKFLEAKYCKRSHSVAKKWVYGQSHTWKRLMDIKKDVEPAIFWKIGRGQISFWWDNWTGLGALANLVHAIRTPKNTLVKDFIQAGSWRREKLLEVLPLNVVNVVQEVDINELRNDCPYWMPENSGVFTCKSAWDIIRKKKGESLTCKKIWHKKMPFKISFFMMRLLQARIPTDDVVKKFGIMIPSKCCCCNNHDEETISHLFSSSQIATQIWSYFCNAYGIRFIKDQIRQTLMNWWLAKERSLVHSMVLQCLPSLICWEIWKNRCSARFEDIHMSRWHIIQQVSNCLSLMLNCQFPSLTLPHVWLEKCRTIEKIQHSIHSQAVWWKKPDRGWVKLNVDGCSKGNPGSAGGGGIIRDQLGDMVKAFAEFYGHCSNNMAEAKAVLHGIKLCNSLGLQNVIVETDSLLIVSIINRRMKPPWRIKHIIEQIWEITSLGNFNFVHTFREGNYVADQLANLGENTKEHIIFNEVVSLPRQVRASLQLEQDGLPNFRFTTRRNQFTINDVIT